MVVLVALAPLFCLCFGVVFVFGLCFLLLLVVVVGLFFHYYALSMLEFFGCGVGVCWLGLGFHWWLEVFLV